MGNAGVSRFSRAKGVAALFIVLGAPWASDSVGDSSEKLTPCEQRALKNYSEALRLCELAQDPNPRLRCYEAAKAVYLRALEDCCNHDESANGAAY